MKELEIEILKAVEVRRALTTRGDIRAEIEYQNDVNALLARVEQWQMPWRSASDISPPALPSPIVVDATPLPLLRKAGVGLPVRRAAS